MNFARTRRAPRTGPSRIRRFAAGMLGVSLVGGGLFFGGVGGFDAAPAEAATYSPTCAAELTSAALDPSTDLNLSGLVLETWLKPNWEFSNLNQSSLRGQASFDIAVSDQAKPGDTYTLKVTGIGSFAGAVRDLVSTADGQTIATAKAVGAQSVVFTFTDYVATHKNVTATYSQSYGYANGYSPDGTLIPGKVYTTTYSGCENGTSVSFDTTTKAQYNTPGLRSSWVGSQDEANLAVIYNGQPAKSANDLTTVTLGIDRPGTKFDCTQLNNGTAQFGIGYGVWNGNVMTDAKLSTQTATTPKPGEYHVLSCTDREIKIEWMPQAAGETFRAQLQTIPDGTTGWQALGRTPFTITAHEDSLEHGTFDPKAQPVRPFTDGSGNGNLNYVDPVITKVRAADGSFTLTVTNSTTDGVVKAQDYTDALYTAAGALSPNQLVISEPSMGSVTGNVWHLPMLAPGESATAKVAFDESTIPAGSKITNRFGIDKSDCVTGALDPAELGPLCAEVVVEVPPATVVPTQPTIVPAECTTDDGKTVWDTVTAPAAVKGLTFSPVTTDAKHVATVIATPDTGFAIDKSKLGEGWTLNADGTATWTHQLESKDCPRAVTPSQPTIAVAECTTDDAGKTIWDTVSAPAAVEGLTFSPVTTSDQHVATVTATPEKGFVIDGSKLGEGWKLNDDGTATWTHQLESKDCPKAVTPPTKPGTPTTPGTPTKPAKPTEPGLAITGGAEQMGLAAGAGVLLLAGIAAVAAGRGARARKA